MAKSEQYPLKCTIEADSNSGSEDD
jgi:hypothetical protein